MNFPLIIAGTLSLVASLLHLLIIYKGTTWYAFFHAGDRLVQLSKQGSLIPAIVTLVIAFVLFVCSFYAFSGAKLIRNLPFLKPILMLIAIIYILRGFVIIPLFLYFPQKADSFMIWSSVICLVIGMFYFIGMYRI